MKKTICIIIVAVITLMFSITLCNADNIQPKFDASFNNGNGIFYANGTPITIKQNSTGDTVVYWNGGEQIVPQTVTIVGGGEEGSNIPESNITMESGTVSLIYGGGASLNENNKAVVEKSNIVINNGKVLQTIYGGGLLFTTTTQSNVTINDGTIKAICGGGSAAATISGVTYAAGTVTDLQNSKNRVQTANIIINGGKIDTEPTSFGSIFGGGQGYSYVENANIQINDGDMSKAYIVAGGSNGYTKNANVKASGGEIYVLQTVNRGEMESATVRIDGGTIVNAYVGGENDSSVTGKIEKVDFAILGGTVTNLSSGVSESLPIEIEQNDYKAVVVEGTVENSEIQEQEVKIQYNFNIVEEQIKLRKGESVQLTPQVITTPTGYEGLFEKENIIWNSADNNVITVNENGVATAIEKGNTVVTANLIDIPDTVQIEVIDTLALFLIALAIIGVGIAFLIVVLI